MSVGAQPTDRVAYLCGKLGIIPLRPHRISVERAVPKELREKKVVQVENKPGAGAAKKAPGKK
jgi:hypothetical protein